MWSLLTSFSWQELRHHPWRNASALLAVMLGVALAFSVHLINASALDEFAQAARNVSGLSDAQLRADKGFIDEQWYRRVANTPGVAVAVPVLDLQTYVVSQQNKKTLRVLGTDLLSSWQITPALSPQPEGAPGASPLGSILAPGQAFLNPAAFALLQTQQDGAGATTGLRVQAGAVLSDLQIAGRVAVTGPATALMDIGAAQDFFNLQGKLSHIEIKLSPSVTRQQLAQKLQAHPDWQTTLRIDSPQDGEARVQNLSRAYRVNLTVLALIALFTGAFLVFSVLSLSVAKRAQQFALLGVLGLSARQRLGLVVLESLVLGLVGSTLGIVLGASLARIGLNTLGGDLGGGFFSGAAPALQISAASVLVYGALGVAAALLGGWWPARQAAQLPPAQTLKGLLAQPNPASSLRFSLACLASAALLSQAPPIGGIALAAYGSVALLLIGGITALPWLLGFLWRDAKLQTRHTLLMLALERARRQRHSAAVAVGSVVASLSLAVALTVMVASFRESVSQWLHQILPADLYLRSARSTSASATVYFSPSFVEQVSRLAGVRELQAQRQELLQLDAHLPALTLLIKPLRQPAKDLPLRSPVVQTPEGFFPVYVSEAVIDLYQLRPGQAWPALGRALSAGRTDPHQTAPQFAIAGVWRDYARQSGAVVLDATLYATFQDDRRANDLAIWLRENEDLNTIQGQVRELMDRQQAGAGDSLDFATAQEIRALSLRIFDRSFAVTYWLQSVAIAIGLFGVAASFSAQVFARRKEFGLLSHLGLTRSQILSLVAIEGAAWTSVGALAGLLLGLIVAWILVDVVNPQSFHWTMDLIFPWTRLLPLLVAVVLSGTLTAWLSGRAAAARDAVLAVKEDW